eukprot:CAMPEP_0184645570 /NCGR_PEP_ID=MMETSP0308-20130426/2094_1 /TAXON_ID=38269 /ORGANISM="Gloeochaete witrockiana, Strain SAG 46.84" /LENGTH=92 /DNA_ID=CAMNT_0027074739 /DNA_START=887 /DNA_END=1165 /DNA_ORIENTATION=-
MSFTHVRGMDGKAYIPIKDLQDSWLYKATYADPHVKATPWIHYKVRDGYFIIGRQFRTAFACLEGEKDSVALRAAKSRVTEDERCSQEGRVM